MFRNNKDLPLIIVITLVGALLAFTGTYLNGWLSIFGILMVFVLPGYLFSQLLLPRLPFEERLLVSLGLSIVIVGFSGLLLDLLPGGLNPVAWAVWLALVILIGVAVLWWRREAGLALPFTSGVSKVNWRIVLPVILTLALVVFAWSISQADANQLNAPLTMLWASVDPAQSGVLNIGVQNEEKSLMIYNIIIQQNGALVNEWAGVAIDPGATFTGQFTFAQAPKQPVTVLLYRSDKPGQVYRQVRIDFSQGKNQATGK